MDGGNGAARRLRIGIVAPPLVRLPPRGYAGTERIVAALALGLHERGHEVTVFATGDSDLPCEVVPVVPESLWARGLKGDTTAYLEMSVALAWEQASRFDVIHSHVEQAGFLMARHCGTPVLTTLHKRVDVGGVAELIDLMPDVPLVAISESQRRWNPGANWIATIHHGLDFASTPSSTSPGDHLLLVGRVSHDKGVVEAIEVARRTGRRLVMAAKVHDAEEHELFDAVVRPAIDAGIVDWRGEVQQQERDRLMADAHAALMLGAWPEPFGLVAIETMATGTPVIARRAGGVTETVEHGSTGFLVDDVNEAVLAVDRVPGLRRDRIAAYARGRFSADRMTALYEQAYEAVIGQAARGSGAPEPTPVPTRGAPAGSGAAPGLVAAAASTTVSIPPMTELPRVRRSRSLRREGEGAAVSMTRTAPQAALALSAAADHARPAPGSRDDGLAVGVLGSAPDRSRSRR